MRTFWRYTLLQVPAWVLAAIVLYALRRWLGLPLWAALALLAAFVIKDYLLYPFLRRAYETSSPTGAEQLIGARGIATEQLSPEGYVRVRGELWKAETAGGRPIPAGHPVRVQAARGLVLVVVPDTENRPGS